MPISTKKVERVKKRFIEHGLEVALNKRKAQRQRFRKLDGDAEAHLIALSCSEPPAGHERWSLRLLADRMVELEYVDSITGGDYPTIYYGTLPHISYALKKLGMDVGINIKLYGPNAASLAALMLSQN